VVGKVGLWVREYVNMWERAPMSDNGGASQKKQKVVETTFEDNNEAEAESR